MATRDDCAAIVMSIVNFNRLGITTTAEGVETLDQLWLVRDAGCTEAQGYLFSKPLPLKEVLASQRYGPACTPGRTSGPGPGDPHVAK